MTALKMFNCKILLLVWILTISAAECRGPFLKMFPEHDNLVLPPDVDGAGDALFLTPLLEAGKIQEARTLSRVQLGHRHSHSFSGLFTVNKKYNSNIFFWFFPARVSSDTAPVLVWLQGGPGGSSLFGLFAEHGPFNVDKDLHLVPRNYTWANNHNIIYIDNPVGTGFSFTENPAGYAMNQASVGRDLYSVMMQFYQLFPDMKNNSLYITGESYAGKYVPALTYTIHKHNQNAEFKMNLKGMAIGDGLCDPVTMTGYGDFLYQIGLLDEQSRDYFHKQEALIIKYINDEDWTRAFVVFDSLLNGDKTDGPSYFSNVTGLNFYFNYLMDDEPKDMDYWTKFINQPLVRHAIHVGNLTFNNGSIVESYLEQDIMKSVKPWIESILDNDYRVMMYNGQLDIIIAYPLTENFLNSMNWKHAEEYRSSQRHIWKVDGQVAGYVREVPNFVQVLVRNAGHILPYDQPKWAFEMISMFTMEQSFV